VNGVTAVTGSPAALSPDRLGRQGLDRRDRVGDRDKQIARRRERLFRRLDTADGVGAVV
jgi:hypothetical protein